MSETASLPPPSESIINLAIVELVIYGLLLPPTLYITWKHGKKGMTCWSILISFIAMRFLSDIYQIIHRNEPNIPGAVLVITNAGSIACLTLGLIGILYETNIILPYPARWTEKLIMAATNLTNTAGIAMATYGGAPSATGEGGVTALMFDRLGNILMLIVMFALYAWVWPTWLRVWSVRKDPNFKPAVYMLVAAIAGLPFQLVRIIYNTVHSFQTTESSLDPIMGIFATRFIYLFVTQLGVMITILIGGYLGICDKYGRQPVDEEIMEQGIELSGTRSTTLEEPSPWSPTYGNNSYGNKAKRGESVSTRIRR